MRIVDFIRCKDWEYHPQAKCGMEPAAALLVGAVVQMLALGAYGLQEENARVGTLSVYLITTIIPVGGLAFLVWDHTTMSRQKLHSFDASTVRFSRWGVTGAVVAICLVGTIYINNFLPAAQPVFEYIDATTAEPHKFDSGAIGVKVVYEFEPKAMRNPFEVNLAIDKRNYSEWKVVDVDGMVFEDGKWERTTLPPIAHDSEGGTTTRVFWHRLKPDRKYQLTAYLQSPSGKGFTPTQMAAHIREKKGIAASYLMAK